MLVFELWSYVHRLNGTVRISVYGRADEHYAAIALMKRSPTIDPYPVTHGYLHASLKRPLVQVPGATCRLAHGAKAANGGDDPYIQR